MAREYRIVWAGRHRRDEWEGLCGRYRKRIESFRAIRDVPVRVPSGGEDSKRLVKEGRALLGALPEPCWSIALDRRGRTMSSRELATRLGRLNDDWPHPVAFLIGSDLGLSREVLTGCRETLSFGPMTLPHELARLLLYEQLYRALSINSGIKYHREPL
jgi:23S rRNA (pseudouridine1915-N3)-methyltransferase